MPIIKNYDRLFDMLPTEMKPDENSEIFKSILEVYSKYADELDDLNEQYSRYLDIEIATGTELDLIGAMFGIHRDVEGEGDVEFKLRIIATIISRKIPTTIPEIQQAIDSIVDEGRLFVMENHTDMPCNIYLTGTADEESIRRAVDTIASFLPAGVRLVIAVVTFETWKNIRDQYISWQSMIDLGVIW